MADSNRSALSRRRFLEGALAGTSLAALLAVPVVVSCASDDSSSSSSGGLDGTISGNHGHTVTITDAQLTDGAAVTLTLTTGSSHTHTLSVTAQDVQDMAAGTQVAAVSSTDDLHAHSVTFN